nr:centromere protein N-like [Nerophis lumbriciformis]
MEDPMNCLLRRLIQRIPSQLLRATMEKWDRLTEAQRQTIDFTQSKWAITDRLYALGEENGWTVKHIAELEMCYVIDNPNQGLWKAFQLVDPKADAQALEFLQFKQSFKNHLNELVRNVSVKIKKNTDEAVWIRIAWGDSFSRPNNLKPTYVVHYLQTPYVFVCRLTSKQKPLLSQALILSTRHQAIKDANLSGRKLTTIRDLLLQQYEQVFPTRYPSSLASTSQTVSNPHIEREQAEDEVNRLQKACEAFGGGKLPELQSVVYKLETKFRDPTNKMMSEQGEPFNCTVKFSSTNILESLRHCASSGIASTPVTLLLSSIPRKRRNYFVITDNVPGPSSQPNQPPN